MAIKERGNSKREQEDATEASTTALELNTTGAGTATPTTKELNPPDPPLSPDTGTPLPDDPGALKENVKGLKSQLRRQKRQSDDRSVFTKRRFLFPLGIISCVLSVIIMRPYFRTMAYAIRLFCSGGILSELLPTLPEHLQVLLDDYEFSMPAIPAFDLSAEWERFKSNIPEPWKLANDGREFLVGEEMKSRGLEAKYPVVLIPGIISTGLESWSTSPEYRGFFRQKVWGGFSMVSQVTFNKERWMASLMLDPVTGLDPPGAKVRAAEGLDAASSFIRGYWLWSKIIENLAVVNYDTNNLYLAPYDWRLSLWNLEERDGYFSKLKSIIEGFKKRQKRKTVLAAHSMGTTVTLYFFKWVESPEHGGGGPNWVEDHIESLISVAGTHLGVAKAMAAFLSGEMKDTVQVNPAGSYVLERFFSRKERAGLFRSWVGSASMWIKGGDIIWGNSTHAPDDIDGSDHSHGELIAFRAKLNDAAVTNMTADNAGTWILEHTPTTFQKMLATNFSYGVEKDETKLKANDRDHTKWSNPLESRLPIAPSMKFFCVYGHGKDTERSYWYTRGQFEHEDTLADAEPPTCAEDSECETTRSPLDLPLHKHSCIDNEYTDQTRNPKVLNGVKMGEGDGTVSLLSLGAMCVEGWKRKRWNPGGIKVTTIELPHKPIATIPRGGGYTSDHVDILGSTPLSEVILKVATGAADEIKENFVSDIRRYAKRIQWD